MDQQAEQRAANRRAKKTAPSKVEVAKGASRQLRGTIAEVLASTADCFEHDDQQLLKFHGIYQQEDRDLREAAKQSDDVSATVFMCRTALPAGTLSGEQYLALDLLADHVSHNGSLRVTTRQGFQFHGVIKSRLKETVQRINQALITTLAACGDVKRNVMATPAPLQDPAHVAIRSLARRIAAELSPQSGAYHEIWLDGEKAESGSSGTPAEEPIYGQYYLPRKFKVGIALPEDNSIDVQSQDVGLLGIVEDGELLGVDVFVGGGLGMTHRKPETYARLGTALGFVEAARASEVVKLICEIFRDHGDRADRKHARLKYIIEEWGIDAFRDEVERRAPGLLQPWREVGELRHDDYLGARPQGDGRWCYGVFIENGRIVDRDGSRLKTALRTIVEQLGCDVVLTPTQSLLFANLAEADIAVIEGLLAAHGVPTVADISMVRRHAMACPAMPTCGLALAESERELPGFLDELEVVFEEYGLETEPITVRMTGCPNGCARPYTADLALVGRKPETYDVFVGGSIRGHRMADLYAENVGRQELIESLRPLLQAWAAKRVGDEPLGDFYQRLMGHTVPAQILTGDRSRSYRDEAEAAIARLA